MSDFFEPGILKPKLSIPFRNYPLEDLKIQCIGYNDFHTVKASHLFKTYAWDSLHYVQSGHGTLVAYGKEYTIGPGSFFILIQNEKVKYYPDENDPWCYYWIDYRGKGLFNIYDRIGLSKEQPVRTASAPERTSQLFYRFFSENNNRSTPPYLALAVALELIGINQTDDPAVETGRQKGVDKKALAENVKKIIELNYNDPDFSVSKIADMLYVSKSRIGQYFQEECGITMVKYLAKFRLDAAVELLRKGDYTVEELCAAVGWGSRTHFMKCFKEEFGITVKGLRQLFTPYSKHSEKD